jgi:hypothetical protein
VIGERGGHATVRWELGEGWVASAAGNGPDPLTGDPGFDEALSAVRAMAESLEPRDPAYWLPIIDRSLRNGDPESTDGYRFGLHGSDGRSYVTLVDGIRVYSTLVVPGFPTDAFQLQTSKILSNGASIIPGEATVVRGLEGVYSEYNDQFGTPRRLLSWSEGPYQYRLLLGPGVDLDEGRQITGQLTPLGERAWTNAVFPDRVPADLGVDRRASIAVPEIAFQVPGEATPGVSSGDGQQTATTTTGSGP